MGVGEGKGKESRKTKLKVRAADKARGSASRKWTRRGKEDEIGFLFFFV